MIQEKKIPEEKIVVMKNKGTKNDIPTFLSQLSGWIEANFIKTKGEYFTLYYTLPKNENETIVYDLGVPINPETDTNGDKNIEVATLGEHTVISGIHEGEHDNIRETYDEIIKYCQENKYDIIGAPKEIFITDPLDDNRVTEIQIPVIKM